LGKVVGTDPDLLVHNKRLGEANYKVEVVVIMKGREDEPIPIPVGDEITKVGQALDTYVRWPIALVLNNDSSVSDF